MREKKSTQIPNLIFYVSLHWNQCQSNPTSLFILSQNMIPLPNSLTSHYLLLRCQLVADFYTKLRIMFAVSQTHVCCVTDSCLLCLRLMFALSQTCVYIAPDLCLLCLRLVFAVSQTGSFKKARFNRLKESETFETQTKMCELWITKLLVEKGSIKKACFNRLKERRHSKLEQKCVSCEQLSYLSKKAVLQRPVSIVSKKVRHLKHETVETSFFRLDRLTIGYSLRRLKQIILGLSKFTPWWNMVLCLNTNFDQIWKNRVP